MAVTAQVRVRRCLPAVPLFIAQDDRFGTLDASPPCSLSAMPANLKTLGSQHTQLTMRVYTPSRARRRAAAAGTKLPTWAMMAINAHCLQAMQASAGEARVGEGYYESSPHPPGNHVHTLAGEGNYGLRCAAACLV